jgi:RNA polymerase sigma-70 factor (ECF subfamily)
MDTLHSKFEYIYDKESDAVFRFCLLRVSNRDEALDITHECFMKFWRSMQNGNKIGSDRALLYTIARHLIIDWYRKKKSISLDSIMEERDNVPGDILLQISIENVEIGSEGRLLLEKLDKLPPSYREPLYLRFVEDLMPEEIGKILGITSNAAGVRVQRGLAELRKITGHDKDK